MSNGPSKYRTWLLLLVTVGLVLVGLFGYEFFYRYPIWTLHAFIVPSSSMCPTICKGERMFVEVLGEKPCVPKRGEVILFDYGPDNTNFLKRVAGIPGDIVGPGHGNTLLVNGRAWQAPPVCAKSLLSDDKADDGSQPQGFKETRVLPGEIFVIGDNLNNSFDSRIEQFEPVTFDKVRGKPVMIFWSPESSRIGCPIK
jgi:signal peptidase I